LPHRSIREAIALAIHQVVHIARLNGRRHVTEVLQVRGYDVESDRFVLDAEAVNPWLARGVAV
jgi:Flp pilus assembly CpaF family ATPase